MLSEALQRNAKHEARLSNISGLFLLWISSKFNPRFLRFAQNDNGYGGHQSILSARQRSQIRLSASLRRALDFIQRHRVFQRGGVAEFFAEIGGADDATHHFRVSRFWYVADEQNFLESERFAKLGGEHVF